MSKSRPISAPPFARPSRETRPTFDKPTFDKPTFDKPTFDKPTFDKPTFEGSEEGRPTFGTASFGKLTTEEEPSTNSDGERRPEIVAPPFTRREADEIANAASSPSPPGDVERMIVAPPFAPVRHADDESEERSALHEDDASDGSKPRTIVAPPFARPRESGGEAGKTPSSEPDLGPDRED